MPIQSDKNLYPGINPHLNSELQQPGGDWQSFHTYHLVVMAQVLNKILPRVYAAKPEQSLQIKIYHPPAERMSRSRTDVLVYRKAAPEPGAGVLERSQPTLSLPMTQVITEMDELTALVIYKGKKPVTRLELLSPGNKPPGAHYDLYVAKRAQSLYAGLRFVEVDYLHERRPTTDQLPSYTDRETSASPYQVIVFDPRPTFEAGHIDIYSFGVLNAMPLVTIPLEGDDHVLLDLGLVYNLTFEERPFCEVVDYTQEPVNFGAYTDEDQARIRGRMAEIAQTPDASM
jgi:hypothetical protein